MVCLRVLFRRIVLLSTSIVDYLHLPKITRRTFLNATIFSLFSLSMNNANALFIFDAAYVGHEFAHVDYPVEPFHYAETNVYYKDLFAGLLNMGSEWGTESGSYVSNHGRDYMKIDFSTSPIPIVAVYDFSAIGRISVITGVGGNLNATVTVSSVISSKDTGKIVKQFRQDYNFDLGADQVQVIDVDYFNQAILNFTPMPSLLPALPSYEMSMGISFDYSYNNAFLAYDFAGNHRPDMPSLNGGLWGRLVTFGYQIPEPPTVLLVLGGFVCLISLQKQDFGLIPLLRN